MSDAPPNEAGAKPRQSLFPPSRIAVIVFAVVALVVTGLELRARMAWDSSYKAVYRAVEESDRGGKEFFKKDVDALVGGSPARQAEGEDVEVFTWSGILKTYRMRLRYDEEGRVTDITPE